MKITIYKKRYDSERCEILGRKDHTYNDNYCGTTYMLRAADGQLLAYTKANGMDARIKTNLRAFDYSDTVDNYEMSEEQEKRCAELGLIEII